MEPSPSGLLQAQRDVGVWGMQQTAGLSAEEDLQPGVYMDPLEIPPRPTCTTLNAAQQALRGQGHGLMVGGTVATRGKQDGEGSP